MPFAALFVFVGTVPFQAIVNWGPMPVVVAHTGWSDCVICSWTFSDAEPFHQVGLKLVW